METTLVETLGDRLEAFWARFAPLFRDVRRARLGWHYLGALLQPLTGRRNAAHLAEATGTVPPRALQRLLTNTCWSVAPFIATLQQYVGERLGTPEGMFLLDESGFRCQGTTSAGVAEQYCGAVGRVAPCQVGVFLAYASDTGHALVDARLYVPESWQPEQARWTKARIPRQLPFHTKPALALGMLRAAKARGSLPARWVLADEVYGRSGAFRAAVADLDYWYLVEVPSNTQVVLDPTPPPRTRRNGRAPHSPRHVAVRALRMATPPAAWTHYTVGESSHGPRAFRFSVRRVWEWAGKAVGRAGWLIIRQTLDGREPRYFLTNAPATMAEADLVRVVGRRWGIETEFRLLKSDLGLDEYDVRSWPGWYHHILLCLVAGTFLLDIQQDWEKKGAGPDPEYAGARRAEVAAAAALVGGRHHGLGGSHPDTERPREAVPY